VVVHDDPHAVAAPGINDHQETTESVHTERDETLLVRVFVRYGDRQIIAENGRGIGKINPVLLQIRDRLPVVPFELHSLTICTSVHTVKIKYNAPVQRRPNAVRCNRVLLERNCGRAQWCYPDLDE